MLDSPGFVIQRQVAGPKKFSLGGPHKKIGVKGSLWSIYIGPCVCSGSSDTVTNLRSRARGVCACTHVLVHKGSRHAHLQTTRE
jgi:hypothetical protein